VELTELGERVLGSLAEKERTVPDAYPLTLNALVSACNQTSNRWPVMKTTAVEVRVTLDQLKADGLVRFVHPARGERSTRFRQVLDERLALDSGALAVLAVLLVRGPQTAGELRGRTERLHAFESVEEVLAVLQRLSERPESLVRLLERRPGERDPRWMQLLGGDRLPPAAPEGRSGRAEADPDGAPGGFGGPIQPAEEMASPTGFRSEHDRAPGAGLWGPSGLVPAEEPNAALVAAIAVLSGRVTALEDRLAHLAAMLGEDLDD
jgi:uncharacterized protein YceH (UPF0502 family)